jgi:hypothetical protein
MDQQLLATLLASIETNSLVIVCGAGLSRTEPSNVPAASELATYCARTFTQSTGLPVPDGSETDLEILAQFLFQNPIHWRLFLERIVNWGPFVRGANVGHVAVADFLCCGAVRFVVTTNFDVLIEFAAENMGEPQFRASLDGDQMQRYYSHRSVLKLHGCARLDQEKTVWCKAQYDQQRGDLVIRERLRSSETWLSANLRGCHILIVGFWSDWPHLNEALAAALAAQLPASILVVDLNGDEQLRRKAPELWDVAERLGDSFIRVRASGAEFLDEFRKQKSLKFFERVLNESVPTYRDLGGTVVGPVPVAPMDLTSDELYDLRRDICGVAPGEVVRDHVPSPNMRGVGAAHLLVQEKGSRFSGNRYKTLDGRTLRVVNGASDSLYRVKDRFSKGQSLSHAEEVVICVATIGDGNAPANVVRDTSRGFGDVVRQGSEARWLSFEAARVEGLC